MSNRVIALLYGTVCHTVFALGIGLMMFSLCIGLDTNFFELEGISAVLWNCFLLIQFPLLHSYFLSKPGRKLLSFLAPKRLRAEMGTTLYAILASLQLILVFGSWAGTGYIFWKPTGGTWLVLFISYCFSWLLLLKAMSDADLAVQTGVLGWWAVFRGRKPVYKKFPTKGLNTYTRNPIYVAFTLILWTAPVWSLDRLLLTLLWTAYCVIGPVFKERRYQNYYAEDYLLYKQRVPYWIPRFPKRQAVVSKDDRSE